MRLIVILIAVLSLLSPLAAAELWLGAPQSSWNGELTVAVALDAEGQRSVSAELHWDEAGMTLLQATAVDPAATAVSFTTASGEARLEVRARSGTLAPGVIAQLTFARSAGVLAPPRIRLRGVDLIPAATAADTVGSASAGSRRRGVRPLEPKSAMGLIDEALVNGAIDAETALVYKVLASFEDPRLPPQYRGTMVTHGIDTYAAAEAAAVFETLSPASQQIIGPFLVPPFHEGSWDDIRSTGTDSRLGATGAVPCGATLRGWTSVLSPSRQVRIWWKSENPADQVPAEYLASVADKMLLKFSALLGRNPILDNGSSLPCRGGDDAIDVAFVNKGSEAIPFFPVTGPGSSYVLLERTPKDGLEMTLAHELFHVMQYTFDMAGAGHVDYRWLMEATATWAQDHYSPAADTGREHRAAPFFLGEKEPRSLDFRNDKFEYGAYLFFLYLTRTSGDAVIRSIWEKTASMSALEAVNASINGGFRERWPEFALYNWNSDVVNHYQRWDALAARAYSTDRPVTIPSTGEFAEQMKIDLPHLSAKYYHFVFDAADARTITFYNGLTHKLTKKNYIGLDDKDRGERYFLKKLDDPETDRAKVQALVKVGGQWRVEDWTQRALVTYCRDLPLERVEEIVVIYSNSQFGDRTRRLTERMGPPQLIASNLGCTSWNGSLKWSADFIAPATWTATSNDAVFEFLDFAMGVEDDDGVPVLGSMYAATRGTVTWKTAGSADGCTYSGEGTFDLATSSPQTLLLVSDRVPQSSRAYRSYESAGYGYRPGLTYSETCGDDTYVGETGAVFWLYTRPFEKAPPSGTELKGSYSPPETGWHFEWDLKRR